MLRQARKGSERGTCRNTILAEARTPGTIDLASRLMFALTGPKHQCHARRFLSTMMAACFILASRMRGEKIVGPASHAFGMDELVIDDACYHVIGRLDLGPALERLDWLHSLPDEWDVRRVLMDAQSDGLGRRRSAGGNAIVR